MDSNIIDPVTLFTLQEHIILGSTPLTEINKEEDVYKPLAVVEGMPINLAKAARQKLGTYPLGLMEGAIGKKVLFKLEEIDQETGQTLKDPVVGILDDEKGFMEDEEATGKLYGALREAGIDLHLRKSSMGMEAETPGAAENKA